MEGIAFNRQLIQHNENIDFTRYLEKFNATSIRPINLAFIKDLLLYFDKNECVVPHLLLKKYGVINDNLSESVTELLYRLEFAENNDFKVIVNENSNIEFYLHPDTFKICVLSVKKCRKYITHYILLEKTIKYYNEYIAMRKNV